MIVGMDRGKPVWLWMANIEETANGAILGPHAQNPVSYRARSAQQHLEELPASRVDPSFVSHGSAVPNSSCKAWTHREVLMSRTSE